MSKLLLKDRINKLLTGSNGPERIFYYSGSYKLLKAGKPSEIATDEAVRLMREGSGLVHIVEDTRVWDSKPDAFTGPVPSHPALPEVPQGTSVMNITCHFPAEKAAEIFIE